MTWFLRQATASQEVPLGPFLDSTDGNTEETALSIANTDIKLFKTGATTLASKNSGGATHIATGEYYCVLDATDTDTIGPLMIRVHVAGALAVRVFCVVLDEAVYDSLFGTVALSTLAGTAQTGDSYALANGANGFVALKGDTAAILTDTGTTLDARIPAALVGGRMDSSTGAMAANVLTAAATAADFTTEIQTGLATPTNITGGTITTVTNLTNLPTIPANWLTAAGTAADFSAEVADAVWDEALTGHLAAGTTGNALNAAGSAGDPWTTIVPGAYGAGTAGSRIGRIPDLAAGAAGGLFIAGANAATTVNITGTITTVTTLTNLPAITANWLTAAGTAADFTTEIQAGLATAAAIAALNNLSAAQVNTEVDTAISDAALATAANLTTVAGYLDTEMAAALAAIGAVKAVTDLLPNAGALTNLDAAISTRATPAQVNAEVVDALATDTYPEPPQGTPAATLSLAAKINYGFKNWRNKRTQSATEEKIYADDGVTVDHKRAVSDDGTTALKDEIATGP